MSLLVEKIPTIAGIFDIQFLIMELLSVLEPHLGLILWQTIMILIVIICLIAIIDIATSKFQNNQQLVWLIICIFVPLGGLIYFFIGRKQKIKSI